MLVTAILTLSSIVAWAVTARALFRRWVRNDLGRNDDHNRLANWATAILAIAGALVLPILAFVSFVVRNPPLSQRELQERTRELEAENARLRQAQAATRPTYDAFDQIV